MIRHTILRLCVAATAATLQPVAAHAHSFEAGADAYASFLAGAAAVFGDIGIMLLLLGAGLYLALDRRTEKAAAFAALLGGAVAGSIASLVVKADPAVVLLCLAIAIAGLAALRPNWPLFGLLAIQALVGAIAAWAVFAGHDNAAAPTPVYVGTIFAIYLGVSVSAGFAKVILEKAQRDWMDIAFRALASWVAAVAIITLAFLSAA